MNWLLRSTAPLALLVALCPRPAHADEPMPNVLLLVDSSGSMEYKAGSTAFPQCDPTGMGPSERSRWIDLVEVLTGQIQDYRCQAIDRRTTSFGADFALPSGVPPLDYLYRNPYHRPLSGGCGYGPNNSVIDPNAFRWTEPFLSQYDSPSLACAGTFQQTPDGLIDAFGAFVRFGLMTFDTEPSAATGYSGTTAQYASGVEGAWSYVWNNGICYGLPEGCVVPEPFEVGARNAAAPPWEGRLVPFGKPNPTLVEHTQRNQQVEKVLLTTRPYGASPLAGLLHDAYQFLTLDDTDDELTYVGPQADPLVRDNCRQQVVILLTDGEPNLDLRPFCEASGGLCPFDRTHEIAGKLAAENIPVYVVGFATSNSSGIDCKALTDEDILLEDGLCATNVGDRGLQACCTLHRIAFEGGTGRALFAEDQAALRAELGDVLSRVTRSNTVSSRTRPAVAPAGAPDVAQNARAYRMLSGFDMSTSLWGGKLVRQRYVCGPDDDYPVPPASGENEEDNDGIEVNRGDDFAANLASGAGPERRFYTVLPDLGHSVRSIRPFIGTADPDGVGLQGGTQVTGTAEEFVTEVALHATAMPTDPSASSCAPVGSGSPLNAAECAERILRWTLGLTNDTEHRRCGGDAEACSPLLGAILRSTPRIVDYPNALVQDETYDRFASTYRDRPMVLYTSSNDGLLHAFKVQANKNVAVSGTGGGSGTEEGSTEELVHDERNNELWAYIPPAVLPFLQTQFPGVYQRLLDGEPIVKDIAAEERDGVLVFERSTTGAMTSSTRWRTVLVQAFGEGWPGYFALDITDPVTGPRLLWQLTTAANGEPLFGSGGTPLITSIYIGSGANTKEVAVAVLPGGSGGSPTGSACDRALSNFSHLPSGYQPRSKVNCYPTSAKAARSVTIVRLDTGEILRTFRADREAIPASLQASGLASEAISFESRSGAANAPFDSPMTGRPVSFPSDVGAVADRVFLGDQDGTLWRIDVSAPDPAEWTVDLFFDAYSVDTSAPDVAALRGQPIVTPPILSMDAAGRVTVNFSTGDQEALAATTPENYVWSLREERDVDDPSRINVGVNWYYHFVDGKRVVGPMILMSSTLYFTTFTPDTQTCGDDQENGTSEIYAVDFARPKTTDQPQDGPFWIGVNQETDPIQQQGLITGISLMHLPSCYESAETAANNAYFPGYAQRPRPRGAAPGLFQLTFHTGKTASNAGAGGINAGTVALAAPPSVSRIDSWAAVVD